MAFWALSDPHLSVSGAKPMHIFSEMWRNHHAKIERGWHDMVGPDDVVLVTGDVCWARRFDRSLDDLAWLDALPGSTKLLVRGNHDQWWPTEPREHRRLPATLRLLEGDAVEIAGEVFCGTGGWVTPQDPYFEPLDFPSFERELAALERALEAGRALAGDRGLHVLVHFAPHTSVGIPNAFDRLLRRFPVRSVTYGHYHKAYEWARAPRGWVDGIHYTLASADYCHFTPVRLPIGEAESDAGRRRLRAASLRG